MTISHALTVDVEDYFQVSAFDSIVDRKQWRDIPSRLDKTMEEILALFAKKNAKATFFTLGWVAEHHPHIIKAIVDGGHELASHGYGHQRVSSLSRKAFAQDIRKTKDLLEQIGGVEITGYRAPSFSINESCEWAYDELLASGHKYSSSVYPIKHDHYGSTSLPRFSFSPRKGFLEIPITTLKLGKRNFPAGGGGYFRLLPYQISRFAINQVAKKDQRSAIFYFHPWEIDAQQPRVDGLPWKTKFRHYINLDKEQSRLERLLSDFSWKPVNQLF